EQWKTEVQQLMKKIDPYSFGFDEGRTMDSLKVWNAKLEKLFICGKSLPDFMKMECEECAEGLHFLNSEDSRLKIISWNDGMSGTLQEWRSIAFWKTKDAVA